MISLEHHPFSFKSQDKLSFTRGCQPIRKNPALGSIDQVILDYLLFFSVTRHLCTSSNVKSIIHNPNYPLFPELEIHPFINPLVSKIPSYCPPYFFVAEQDDKCILDSLRVFSQIRKALLLNFRCSIIRALSLGYILGYEHITLVG